MRKERKGFMKQLTAWVLTLVMVLSLVMVPAGEAKAAESVTVTDATNSSKDVYAIMTVERTIEPYSNDAKNWPTVQLTQYKVSIVNNTDTVISDWQLTIGCTATFNSTTYNAGWNGAPSSVTGTDIVITTYKGTDEKTGEVWDNATIEAGKTLDTGAGFQVATSTMAGATYTLTYNVGESSGNVGQDDTQTDPSQIGTTSASVTASVSRISNASSGDYQQYYLTVNNGLSTSIGDWIVVVPITGVMGSDAWDSSWAYVGLSYTDSYIYLTPKTGSSGVIAANSTYGGQTDNYKIHYKGPAISDTSGIKVYYKEGSSYTGAFGNVVENATQASGSSSGESGGGSAGGTVSDTTTDRNLDIEYNYAKLLQESLYFFDANMCGTDVGETTALSWRNDCHGEDATFDYDGETVDVSGGFHDAGDHVKFGLPQGYSAAMLALSYKEFGEAFDGLGQTEHYKKIMEYFCDYFVNCAIYTDNANKTGSVKAFCYQVGDGTDNVNYSDHAYWGPPEKQTGYNRKEVTLFTTDDMPATDIVSISACALALHAYNFPNDAKSTQYLQTAKDLFAYAKSKDPKPYWVTQYRSETYKDDYASAAAALYLATKDATYLSELNSNYAPDAGWTLCWDKTWGIAAALKGDWNMAYSIANYNQDKNTDQGFRFVDQWGSARYNAAEQFLGLVYDKNTSKNSFGDWATGQMNYLLGNNDNKRCFVVGYNENSAKYPHHRAASNSSDASIHSENHYTLLGALVGGPNDLNDSYSDSQTEYVCNEVAIDYNVGLVGAAAGLYLLHKDDDTVPTTLATEEELREIGVTQYYGTTTPSTPVTSITLDKETLSLTGSQTATITATILPAEASQKVKWTSSNENVATVDSNGKVTAKASGTATITATTVGTTEGGETLSDTCTVTVTNPLTAFTLDKTSVTIERGGTAQLSIASTTPTNPDAYTPSWTSGNSSYATIDQNGKVTAVGIGTTTITVTINGVSQTCTVSVVGKAVKGISLDKSTLSMKVKDVGVLVATVTPDDADDKTVNWSSSNAPVVTVDQSGNITAVSAGTAKITAKAGNFSAECTVTVEKKENETVGAPTSTNRTNNSITITPASSNREQEYLIVRKNTQITENTWKNAQTTTTFSGLDAFTAYDIYARTKETDEYKPGATSQKLTVYTLVAEPFTIDVSKLNDSNYIDALRMNNSTMTVAYDENTQTLTLKHNLGTHQEGYTIVGENAGVTIKTNSGNNKITLQDTIVKCIDASMSGNASVEIVTIGNVEVKEGILSSNNSELDFTFSGTGTLDTSHIQTKGDVAIQSGTINADASNTTNSAISGNNVTITGGTVTATGGSGQAAITAQGNVTLENATVKVESGEVAEGETSPYAIQGNKIVIEGNTSVSSENSNDETLYSTDPVDANGHAITQYSVILTYEDGTQTTAKVKADQNFTLPSIPATKGYTKHWKSGDTSYAVGDSVGVNGDMEFTVEKSVILVSEVKLGETSKTLTVGDNYNLTVTVSPADALDTSVTWSSDNAAVATVDANGKVTAVAAGTANIIAKANDTSGKTASCTVTVQAKPIQPVVPPVTPDYTNPPADSTDVAVERIEITGPTKKVAPGKKVALVATIYPDNATNQSVVWKVSDSRYASVNDKGVVTTKKKANGKKVTVTACSAENGSIVATYKISIMKNPVKKIKLSAKTTTLKKGKSVTVKAKFTPAKGISKELTWTSSNPKVATVNAKGKVTAKKKGTAKITAKAKDGSGKKATIKIRVK